MCTKHDYEPIVYVNVLSKGKNREQSYKMLLESVYRKEYII